MPNISKSQTFNLYLLDLDYIINEKEETIIRLFTKDDNNNYIIVHDTTFKPYFYIIPKDTTDIEEFKTKLLNAKYIDETNQELKIDSIEILTKNIDLEKQKVLKIFTKNPTHNKKIKQILKKTNEIKSIREADIPFYKRYLFDKDLAGLKYLEVQGNIIENHNYKQTIKHLINATKIISKENQKTKCNILAFDIETVPDQKKQFKIISIGFYSTDGLKKVIGLKKSDYKHLNTFKTEKELLIEFINILNTTKYDLIATYNGDQFDFEVINTNAKYYNLNLNISPVNENIQFKSTSNSGSAQIKGIPHFDVYKFIIGALRTSLKSNTYSLDNIASEVLHKNKIPFSYKDIQNTWDKGTQKDFDKLYEYNLRDCELTEKLATYFFSNLIGFCNLTNLTPFEICRTSYGNLVESFLIKRAKQLNYLVPNKPSQNEMSQRRELGGVEGAYVVDPTPGLHKNIAVFDFKSLYPSIIISHNISKETLNCGCCKNKKNITTVPGKPYYFCTQKKALIPIIIEDILNTRAKVKKEMNQTDKTKEKYLSLYALQFGLKTVANAFYGYIGFPGSRFYKRECAESVTAYGRNYIHKTIDIAKKHNFESIYGDTDSIFLKLENQTETQLKTTINQFLEYVNKDLPGVMELEFEELYKTGLFVSKKGTDEGIKKRYALLNDDGSLTIKGFENVRRDWSNLAKDTQYEILKLVLHQKKQKAIDYSKQIIQKLMSNQIPLTELVIYTKITRPINSYKSKGPHVHAAIKAIDRGMEINPGTIVGFVITQDGKTISDKAELLEFAKNYDPDYYLNNQLLPSILKILEVIGIDENTILGKTKQSGLGSFV
jgi:DNA polymerase, archaea type